MRLCWTGTVMVAHKAFHNSVKRRAFWSIIHRCGSIRSRSLQGLSLLLISQIHCRSAHKTPTAKTMNKYLNTHGSMFQFLGLYK